MPDITQEFGPRDQLVRVRCRGSFCHFKPAPHRSVFRYRSSIRSRTRPRRGGRRNSRRQLPCPDLVQAPGNGPATESLSDRRPPTRTKGSTPGRGNATGNAKTDNRSATIGKEHDLAKARRIARFTRFLVAADNFDNCLDSFFRLQPTNNIESLLRIHWLFLPGSGGKLPDFIG